MLRGWPASARTTSSRRCVNTRPTHDEAMMRRWRRSCIRSTTRKFLISPISSRAHAERGGALLADKAYDSDAIGADLKKSAASSPSDRQRPGLGRGVALADLRPVHHVPPRLEVVTAAVLVGEIIGVLPHVVSQQHALSLHQRGVLVGLR